MPEGPSIVILKEAVQQFKGKKVLHATSNNKLFDALLLEGKTITDFKSWGKHFLICFPDFTIRIHLMMFGSYRINDHTAKPARLHLQFADGELNFYACLLLLIEENLDEVYDWSADIMSPEWSSKKAVIKLRDTPEMPVCDALMDQQLFAGVGNIIKNEVLFRTRIHPLSPVGKIPPKKLNELLAEVVTYSFEFLEWKKANTLKKHWLAYSKKTCPRNHVPFHSVITGKSKRRSFFCTLCQALYD